MSNGTGSAAATIESLYADKLYPTRKNRERLRQIRTDEDIRNAVEGKFGQAKNIDTI